MGLVYSKKYRSLAILVGLFAGAVLALGAGPGLSGAIAPAVLFADLEQPRTIVLEAEGLAFGGTNPTLELRAGEAVRIIVRNTDPGVTHAFEIPAFGQKMRSLKPGEEFVVDFKPEEAGEYEYTCPRHLPSMKGAIIVRK